MFTYRFDPAYAVMVWLFAGETNSDEDYQRYVDTFARADALAAHHPKPAGILYVERDNPLPDAKWRERFAEASLTLRTRPAIAFASPSPLVRGIVTAVNWLRPPPFEFTTTDTFDEAVRWLEHKRGVPMKIFFDLFAECWADVARGRPRP